MIMPTVNNFRASLKSSCNHPRMASFVLARVENGDGGEYLHLHAFARWPMAPDNTFF